LNNKKSSIIILCLSITFTLCTYYIANKFVENGYYPFISFNEYIIVSTIMFISLFIIFLLIKRGIEEGYNND
jgi:hypothetical protein